MTSIDRLRIRGIRAFSPNRAENIKFDKPLTLIVGPNGSGKTTIIECLKMACTGDLPPNCKSGQAFINDPTLHDQAEVKAQIRLKFTSLVGRPVMCIRSFSLTQKATKKEYKAFESALHTLDSAGNKMVMSYKCADLNKLVPEMMGVSQAVLESVIFVHQEDSCWPLAEDKVLKDRFDSIFASTQFTKALDEINKLKKSKKNEEKVLNAEFGELEEKLRSVNALREQKEAAERSLDAVSQLISTRRDEMEGLCSTLAPLHATRAAKAQLRSRESNLEAEHRHAAVLRADSKKRLITVYSRELTETTDQIHASRDQLGGTDASLRDEINKLEVARTTAERDAHSIESEREEARRNLSRLEAATDTMRAVEKDTDALLGVLGRKYDLGIAAGRGGAVERGGVGVAAVQRQLELRVQALSESKTRWHSTLGGKQQQLSETRAALTAAERDADAKRRAATALQSKMDEMAERVQTLASDEARTLLVRRELASLKQECNEREAELSNETETRALAAKKREVRELKDRHRALMEEHQAADTEGGRRAKVEQLQEQAKEQAERLQENIAANRSKLERVLGLRDLAAELQAGTLLKQQQQVRRTRDDEARAEEEALEATQRELNKVAGKQQAAVEMFAQKQAEAEALAAELEHKDARYAADGFDFDRHVRDREEELHAAREQAPMSKQSMLQLLESTITLAEKTGKCKMCDQDCKEPQIHAMRSKRQRMSTNPTIGVTDEYAASAQAIAAAEKALTEAVRAADTARRLRELRQTTLKQLSDEVEEHKASSEELKRKVDEARARLATRRKAEAEAADSRADVLSLKSIYDAKLKADEEAAAAASAALASAAAFGTTRSKADVKSDLDVVSEEIDKAEKRAEALDKTQRARVAERDEAVRRRGAKEVELTKLTSEATVRQSIEQQRDEVSSQLASLTREAAELDRSLPPYRQQAKHLEAEIERAAAAETAELAAADVTVAEARADASKLGELVGRLREYRRQGLSDMAQRAREVFDSASTALTAEKNRARDLGVRLEEQQKKRTQRDHVLAELSANLEYRDLVELEAARASELEALRTEVRNLPNSASVEAEIAKVDSSIRAKELELTKASGASETFAARLKETTTELSNQRYRHIDQRHADKYDELTTANLAIGDLERYYKALDRSLIRFHQTKMEEINRSAKELWNRTYKGSDIDGIEIKSEHEGYTDAGARKHSYRVMMRKGDNLLDMRGRCSAGQKVLACLIIRLALAESFCLNCGILALDEPTTNLDTANAEAFASALHDVIEHRKAQSNFQLIVITHDEKFVHSLGASGYCNHYYRVSKQLSGGEVHSTIDEVEIAQFG